MYDTTTQLKIKDLELERARLWHEIEQLKQSNLWVDSMEVVESDYQLFKMDSDNYFCKGITTDGHTAYITKGQVVSVVK